MMKLTHSTPTLLVFSFTIHVEKKLYKGNSRSTITSVPFENLHHSQIIG